MLDQLLGRPSASWKRTQVFLVILFWVLRIVRGDPRAPRILGLRGINRSLQRFTPWQIILSTLTALYAVRNLDKILGLGSPEPLANLYSRSYYRATWITTGLDAGFATAMTIRPKWLRDICSPLFSLYYIIYATEADEKLRRFRAVPTVELLRTTWEKTTNPYIRAFTHLPRLSMRRKIHLPRPKSSTYTRPITAYLYFALPEQELSQSTDLVFDIPGGGFVAMTPEHHEERLRAWAIKTRKPILSLEYGKAPEYPYPFAIDEAFDTYRLLVESAGTVIGMSGQKLNIIISGDSAGATLVVNVIIKILELGNPSHPVNHTPPYPLPVALLLTYACLDFNLTSWMTPADLRVLRSEHSVGQLPGMKELAQTKDHLSHISPLSMAGDNKPATRTKSRLKRRLSWKDTFMGLTGGIEKDRNADRKTSTLRMHHSTSSVRTSSPSKTSSSVSRAATLSRVGEDQGALADAESEDETDFGNVNEQDRPIEARVKFVYPTSPPRSLEPSFPRTESALEKQQRELSEAVAEANSKAMLEAGRVKGKGKESLGTRLAMTSRAGYFVDRIIPPTMMRAMAILYIGPHRNPDFATDYHISPILAPSHLLAHFPPVYMQCGEKDPFVDDTVVFAGKIREAKRARKIELDLAIAGKTTRFGEGLRMSEATSSQIDGPRLAAMKRERDKLARESEDDWVQMVLYSDWSHGYLQMPALMREAASATEELAERILDAFERCARVRASSPKGRKAGSPKGTMSSSRRLHSPPAEVAASPLASETETDDPLTFVTKKSRSRVGSDDSVPHPRTDGGGRTRSPGDDCKQTDSSGSEATLHDDTQEVTTIDGCANLKIGSPGTPPGRGSNGNKAGQTISETELMRRRRLLDSHIFE